MSSVTECDLLIVGAGPVGLYAAYYAGFRGLRTALIDSLPEAGGQVTAMYPEKAIGNRYIAVDTTMATSVPGVFAAGDITDYRGKVRLISVGFGEAATAVNNAAVLIRPDEQLFPGHSSDTPPPAAPVAA